MGKGYQVREVLARIIIWSFPHKARRATKPEFQLCFDFWDEAG